jgi:hypothetical protein
MPRSLVEIGSIQSNVVTNSVVVESTTTIPNMTERTVIHSDSLSDLVEIDLSKGTIHYFRTAASGNFQFNFRYSNSNGGISSAVSPGQSLTVAVIVTNAATGYYLTGAQLDGEDLPTGVKWNGAGGAPSAGTENSIDTYVFTFIKKLNGELEILGNAKSSGGTFGTGAPLFSFQNATFGTPLTGRSGPSLAQAQGSLSVTGDNSWTSNTEFFNVISGFQYFTVPETATYRITVAGAQGGNSDCYGPQGGRGAQMRGDFELNSGTKLKMVVGQRGINNCYDGGGGGGTFVCLEDNSPLIIAGGGGGASASNRSTIPGTTSTSGQSASSSGGSNGGGGNGSTAGGGGGLTGNGGGSWGGQAFVNGALGASGSVDGGFGGGGGGGGTNGAGGGGGYSGGSYSSWSSSGGGGGSFNNGSNQSNASDSRSGNGFILIEKV